MLWQCLLEIADPDDLGRLGTLTLQFADLVSSAASEGYLGERERRARSHEEATRLFVTRMLSGDLDDEEAVEILRVFDKKCDARMKRMHIVFGAYRGPIDAKPGEKVLFIGDCANWEGNLGDKMNAFFEHALSAEGDRSVLIGSDSPTLPKEYADQAFEMLKDVDCVIGDVKA